jgi:hypothetical protein
MLIVYTGLLLGKIGKINFTKFLKRFKINTSHIYKKPIEALQNSKIGFGMGKKKQPEEVAFF